LAWEGARKVVVMQVAEANRLAVEPVPPTEGVMVRVAQSRELAVNRAMAARVAVELVLSRKT
jgi:hypothetical protein